MPIKGIGRLVKVVCSELRKTHSEVLLGPQFENQGLIEAI